MKKILIIHGAIWLVISLVYIFLISEPLTQWIYAGYEDVAMWLWVVKAGLFLIFLTLLISVYFGLRKHKQEMKNG